jgi:hypothetical protein
MILSPEAGALDYAGMDVSQGELKLKTVMKAHLSQRERKGHANLSPTRQITAINGVAGGKHRVIRFGLLKISDPLARVHGLSRILKTKVRLLAIEEF